MVPAEVQDARAIADVRWKHCKLYLPAGVQLHKHIQQEQQAYGDV
jgi:hypothetical protein